MESTSLLIAIARIDANLDVTMVVFFSNAKADCTGSETGPL